MLSSPFLTGMENRHRKTKSDLDLSRFSPKRKLILHDLNCPSPPLKFWIYSLSPKVILSFPRTDRASSSVLSPRRRAAHRQSRQSVQRACHAKRAGLHERSAQSRVRSQLRSPVKRLRVLPVLSSLQLGRTCKRGVAVPAGKVRGFKLRVSESQVKRQGA